MDHVLQRVVAAVEEVLVVDLVQDQAGGEGADDGGEADLVRRPGEDEEEDEGGGEEHPLDAQPAGQPEHARRQPAAYEDGAAEEDHRLDDDHQDVHGGELAAGVGGADDAGDDGQDDQAEDVVDDRRAEDDLRLPGGDLPQVGQHPGGDADAGGAEGGADEEVDQKVLVGQEVGRHRPAEEERRHDAEDRHQQAGDTHRQHLLDVGFQADVEEQQDDADLGQDLDPQVGAQEVEEVDPDEGEVAQEDAEHQLAQDRRLADALEHLAAELGHREDDGDAEEDRHDGAAVALALAVAVPLSVAVGVVGVALGLRHRAGLVLGQAAVGRPVTFLGSFLGRHRRFLSGRLRLRGRLGGAEQARVEDGKGEEGCEEDEGASHRVGISPGGMGGAKAALS